MIQVWVRALYFYKCQNKQLHVLWHLIWVGIISQKRKKFHFYNSEKNWGLIVTVLNLSCISTPSKGKLRKGKVKFYPVVETETCFINCTIKGKILKWEFSKKMVSFATRTHSWGEMMIPGSEIHKHLDFESCLPTSLELSQTGIQGKRTNQ